MKKACSSWFNKGLFLLLGALFISLSIVSNYNLISPYEVNFEIANMLTPWGILRNVFFSETFLTPYYDQITSRSGVFTNLWLAILIVAIEINSFYLLYRYRKK